MNISSEDLDSAGNVIASISGSVEMRYKQINVKAKRVNSGVSHGIIQRLQQEKSEVQIRTTL